MTRWQPSDKNYLDIAVQNLNAMRQKVFEFKRERDEARQYIATLEADKRQACRLLRAAMRENPTWYSANTVEAQMFLDVHEEAQP